MANKIRQQKQVRLGSRIYKLLKKKKEKKLEKTNKKNKTIHSMFKRNLRKRGKQCVILSVKN
jgi:ferritin-like metal-binding protein YciE